MKKSVFNICSMGLGIALSFVPLAGNAYYCNRETRVEPKTQVKAKESLNTAALSNDVLSTLNIKAKSCVLMEKNTGDILLQKDSESSFPMASMTKMMTLLLVMEEIDKGTIDINQITRISEFAASQEGSECFLDANKEYTVKELIKSVVVASANDSTVALAELVAGSEEMFAKKMNDKAATLNMTRTHFINSTGLDAKGHVSSATDMCKLMRELSRYERLQEFSHVWMYDMQHSNGRVTNLTNTNRLVRTNPDVKLAKTGHTDGAGFCITTYAVRDGMELIACVMGESDSKDRFEDATKLLNYGFSNFQVQTFATKDTPIAALKIKGGKIKEVPVFVKEDLSLLQQKGDATKIEKIVNLPEQLPAPILPNTVVGEIVFKAGEKEVSCDLVVNNMIEEKTVLDIAKELM